MLEFSVPTYMYTCMCFAGNLEIDPRIAHQPVNFEI